MKNSVAVTIGIIVLVIATIMILYSSNSTTFTDETYRYSVIIPNENWLFIENFEKITILKSDFPHYVPDTVIGGILVENMEKRLYIQIYKDEEPQEDLTNIIESERYFAEYDLENGEFYFPDLPVGDIVIIEWNEENREISTREAIIKKNQLVYFVYYEISFSEKNSDIAKELDSIFRSVDILD